MRSSLASLSLSSSRAPPDLSSLLGARRDRLRPFDEREPWTGLRVRGVAAENGRLAVTHVEERALERPAVAWPAVRGETWSGQETGARERAARSRGAARAVFRPTVDGILFGAFRVGDQLALRASGSGIGGTDPVSEGEAFFANASLAEALRQAGLILPLPAEGVTVTYAAAGSLFSSRSLPDFHLSVEPLYQQFPDGTAELFPLSRDLVVPLEAAEHVIASQLDLRDDRLGLLSPNLGHHQFLVSAHSLSLCSSLAGGLLSSRLLLPSGFCSRLSHDSPLQLSALRALREAEVCGLEPTPPIIRTHMGLSAALWRPALAEQIVAFCANRPRMLVSELERPRQKILLLIGFPGSGKSSACAAMTAAGLPIVRVNQDKLGSRGKCLSVAERALAAGRDVVVDRCNLSFSQRHHFLRLAAARGCRAVAAVLRAPVSECAARVAARPEHETIPAGDEKKARAILGQMQREFVAPVREEGFHQIVHIDTGTPTVEDWLPQIMKLAEE